jgi:ligand-binding sensor domain-containing protein
MVAVLAVCLWAVPARAQYQFDQWSADNGLPQNSVRDILQTRDGYLWFTTFDGLVRFDGVRFTVFNKGNSPGLASNRFVSLFEDREGDLWATQETGEVVRKHQGRFTTYDRAHGLPADSFVPFLDDDGKGNVVVYYVRGIIDHLTRDYTSMAVHSYRWSDGKFHYAEELNSTLSMPQGLAKVENGFVFHRGSDGAYWISTVTHLLRWPKSGGMEVYGKQQGLPGTRPRPIFGRQTPVRAVSRDADDRLWLTDLESMQSRPLSSQPPEGFDVVRGYADTEGNYWFASTNGGLFRARQQAVTPYAKAQGPGETYTLLETRDGSLWVGTLRAGVFRLEGDTFTHFPPPKNIGFDVFGGYASSLYEDRLGQLWVAGVWRLVDGRYLPGPWTNALISQGINIVWTMCEDRDGAYWFGTSTGVARYEDGALTWYTTKDGLAGDDTKVIVEDGQGGLWLGSHGGLTHYKDGTFTAWTEKDGLPGATVRALNRDDDGTLWIGTYDSGLGRFKDGRFTRYMTNDGLFDNGVFQILEDDSGWFWMSCNRGIYRVRKQELVDFADRKLATITCLAFTRSDGMPSN